MPALETNTTLDTRAPPPTNEANVQAKTIAAEDVPLTPPAPEDLGTATRNEGSPKATPPPPPPGKGFFRRLRNLILYLAILGTVGFGGGVYYSRINDNFHDFFTEYVPGGEQAVLYLEEMEFRKRFPNISNRGGPQTTRGDTGEAVKIPAQSGVAWRVADAGEPSGRHSNAADKTVEQVKKVVAKVVEPEAKPIKEKEQPAPKAADSEKVAAKSKSKVKDKAKAAPGFKAPEVDEPSQLPPTAPLKGVYYPDVDEPAVQGLAHMLNGIIAVINNDGAQAKYSSTIDKAKNELKKVYGEIEKIKAAAEKDAAAKVKEGIEAFDKVVNDKLTRVDAVLAAQDAQWQREFDEEMRKIKDSYESRIKVMTEREREIAEQRLGNKMLEQAIELKRQFTRQIKDQVEKERDSRLGRLEELSKSVSDLEKLATGWNEVIDSNLRTQQLHVAVEAVRASLEDAAHPRPFIKELVALKEIAADDSVVNAAIASINPLAYQRGVSNSAELIDRFRRVAAEVRKASLLPEDAGVASHASSFVLSKVLFKKQGLAAGDDVESILTRTQTFLEEGDLDAAAREMNGLSGWAKTLSRDWLGEVRKVLEVRQALEVSSSSAGLFTHIDFG